MGKEKQHINLAIIGGVGKSVLTGHLIYMCGGIDSRTLQKFASQISVDPDARKYAWVVDKLQQERDQMKSIQCTLWKFETSKTVFSLIDTPGSRKYMKSAIRGISQADAALLVVPAMAGGFEDTMSCEVATMRDHVITAFSLGVTRLIVAINGMETVTYDQTRYMHIKKEVSSFLQKVGYKPLRIPFIPVSGKVGDNLIEKSLNLSWYKGYTLLEGLDSLQPPKVPLDKPFRLSVSDIYDVGGIGTVVAGRVQTGTLNPGDEVQIAPLGICCEARSIEMHHEGLPTAVPGDNVGIHLRNIDAKQLKSGCVVFKRGEDPAKKCKEFVAQIIVLNRSTTIRAGYTPTLFCHTAHAPCKFVQLQKLDRRSGKVLAESPSSINTNECAIVKIIPQKPLCIETFANYRPFGRFVFMDGNKVIGVGVVKSVVKED